jgi:murein DD-endopeptidase MepM/ murein hydrolase activator NlpD
MLGVMAVLTARSSALRAAFAAALVAAMMILGGAAAHAQDQPAQDQLAQDQAAQAQATTSDTPTTVTVDDGSDASTDAEDQDPGTGAPVDTEPVFDPTDPAQILRDIVFPVVGASSYSPSFGACRDGCTRSHEGIDIMTYGWKGVPVVAAHDGVVTWANVGGELAGCGIVVQAPDGWFTVYTHLNTDQPGTDDGTAPCFPAGIDVGTSVRAGTLLGWVGDAGNAEETPPHLHFEINHPEFGPVDPIVSLDVARRIEHRWIDPHDLATLAPSLSDAADTVYVVPADELELIAGSAAEPSPIDVPIVPYDPADPTDAWSAIRDIAPERIVVVTADATDAFIGDLITVAAIVEVVVVTDGSADTPTTDSPPEPVDAAVPPDEPTPAPTDDEEIAPVDEPARIDHFEVDDEDFTIVLVTRRAPGSNLLNVLGDHTVVSLVGSAPREHPGMTSTDNPGSDANRNGLWWPSADGWLLTEDPDSPPDPSIAYVAGAQATPWTISYLVSLDSAPRLPLWHHQPTSVVSRSL